jgi:hypothetical protein
MPAELCDIVVDAAYQAEGIEQDPALVRKASHCPKPKEDHEMNWEPSLGRYRNNLEFDEDFLTSGPEDSEQSYDSDDLSCAASSEDSETLGNNNTFDESDVEGDMISQLRIHRVDDNQQAVSQNNAHGVTRKCESAHAG